MIANTATAEVTQVETPKKDGVYTEMTPSHRPAYSQIPRWVLERFVENMVIAGTWGVYLALVKRENFRTHRTGGAGVRYLAKEAGVRVGSVSEKLDWLMSKGLIRLACEANRAERKARTYYIVQEHADSIRVYNSAEFRASQSESRASRPASPKPTKTRDIELKGGIIDNDQETRREAHQVSLTGNLPNREVFGFSGFSGSELNLEHSSKSEYSGGSIGSAAEDSDSDSVIGGSEKKRLSDSDSVIGDSGFRAGGGTDRGGKAAFYEGSGDFTERSVGRLRKAFKRTAPAAKFTDGQIAEALREYYGWSIAAAIEKCNDQTKGWGGVVWHLQGVNTREDEVKEAAAKERVRRQNKTELERQIAERSVNAKRYCQEFLSKTAAKRPAGEVKTGLKNRA